MLLAHHSNEVTRYCFFASGPGSANLAAVGGVGSVGVGAAVNGGAGGREILPPPPLGELKKDLDLTYGTSYRLKDTDSHMQR